MSNGASPSSPGVKFPPPFLYLLGLGVAWLLESRVKRVHLTGNIPTAHALEILGVAVLAAGLVLIFWGLITFARVRTGIIPHKPATQIVEHGPYRFTRNPMYTGMATAYLGGTFIMNSAWALALLPFVMFALYHLVIKREEYYLSSAFPKEYGDYTKRVRRWV
jgi:protein-S-isoprenylcysteine O-methyltransferase Ste14